MYSKTCMKLRLLKLCNYPEFGFQQCTISFCARRNKSSTTSKSTSTDVQSSSSGIFSGSQAPGTSQGWRTSMKSWQMHSYSGPSEIQFTEDARIPILRHPDELLINVKAASVNPIDVAMTKGYGSEVIHAIRQFEKRKLPNIKNRGIEFPITLGRDFSGVVTEAGSGVTGFKVGDEVYGVLGFTENGSHAEYTIAHKDLIQIKPKFLSFAEAASFPYVALTCWSALTISGNLFDLAGKTVLVLGGSGGVGTFAIQYLKTHGAQVISTCSTDAISLVNSLGADFSVDYTQQGFEEILDSHKPYDCILNLSGSANDNGEGKKFCKYLKPVCGQYITLSPPLLSNFDEYGFLGGALKNVAALFRANYNSVSSDRVVTKWAFFVPSAMGLREVARDISRGKIRPVIEKTYPFSELPKAYERIEAGHLRGKIVTELS